MGTLNRKTLVRMARELHGRRRRHDMTLLSVVKDVCAAVGVTDADSPSFTNITGNRTMQEMLALANEMAQRIAYDTRDWTQLKKTATYRRRRRHRPRSICRPTTSACC